MCPLLRTLAKWWVLGKLQHLQNNLEHVCARSLFALGICYLSTMLVAHQQITQKNKRGGMRKHRSKLSSNIPLALHRVAISSCTRRRALEGFSGYFRCRQI